jgi:hypothetical protein
VTTSKKETWLTEKIAAATVTIIITRSLTTNLPALPVLPVPPVPPVPPVLQNRLKDRGQQHHQQQQYRQQQQKLVNNQQQQQQQQKLVND